MQNFFDQLCWTMEAKEGAGLAAPQVGRTWRTFAFEKKEGESIVAVNPKITHHAGVMEAAFEECLSLPSLVGLVVRPKWIEVEYYTRHGEQVHERLDDKVARIFQHEADHLIGRVLQQTSDQMWYLPEWQRQHEDEPATLQAAVASALARHDPRRLQGDLDK